jgi:acyl-CoA synthetase (AMP-forming)/AMP-acid ligase II
MAIRSPWPDINIPEVSVTEFALRHADRLGSQPAVVDGLSGRILTLAQLADSVRRVATGLAQHGFRKGDVFAIYSSNLPEYAVTFLAVASLGGINTTVNPLYTASELAKQLNDSGAKFLITAPMFLDKAQEAVQGSKVEEIFVFDKAEGATSYEELATSSPTPPAIQIDPRDDAVALPFSSGTTGFPKGVMLTHYNLVANLRQCEGASDCESCKEGDRILAVLPLFHIYGMVAIMLLALSRGGTIVTMPRFDFRDFLGVIQKHRVTVAPLVPPIILSLAKHDAVCEFDLSSLRLVFSGAAPLGEDIAHECSLRLKCPVVQGYGMTETSPVTHLPPTRNVRPRSGSVGFVVPNTEAKIVAIDTGAELSAGQEGEIWIRGPQVMKGYLNQPEETAASLDDDGWYHTGDIGYADAEGWFFIVDRIKELIKYKGLQVAPAELETLLLTHPAVLDCAVIRKANYEAGEVPKAFVVLKEEDVSRATAADAIMAYVAARVPPHKRIRDVEFISQIPRSAAGKILRRVLILRENQASCG